MQPQGTALINDAYYQNLITQINNIDVCADLQAVVTEAMASIQAEVTAIEAQIASLVPLITLPTNLAGVITWIGACLLGAHHGHTQKPDRAAMAMAVDCHEDWGLSQHRHIFSGHIHTATATEVAGVRVESFNSPAARDAWNTASGYRSGRSLSAITFHREMGEVGRHRVAISSGPKVTPEILYEGKQATYGAAT